MIKFKAKNMFQNSASTETIIEENIEEKVITVTDETIIIDKKPKKKVIKDDLNNITLLDHIKDTESLLEYVLVKINKLDEDLQSVKDKPVITVEDIPIKTLNRNIIINKDTKGKIIGADITDSVFQESTSVKKVKNSSPVVKRKIVLQRDKSGKIISADILDSVK